MRDILLVCFLVYIVRYQWGLGGNPQKKAETGKLCAQQLVEFESCPVKQQNEANEGLSLAHAAAPL